MMTRFFKDEKGGVIEWILVVGVIGAIVLAITPSFTRKAACSSDTSLQMIGNAVQNQGNPGSCVLGSNHGGSSNQPTTNSSSPSLGSIWSSPFTPAYSKNPTAVNQLPTISGFTTGNTINSPEWTYPEKTGIWSGQNANNSAPNGIPLIFSTVIDDSTNTLTIQYSVDDTAEAYVDGKPIEFGTYNNLVRFSQSVTPGYHTVQFFAENTDGQNPVTSNPNNPANLNAIITDGNGTVLSSTANPNQWTVQKPSNGTFDPYLFGSTSQSSSGTFVIADANYNHPTSGLPIGPKTIPQ